MKKMERAGGGGPAIVLTKSECLGLPSICNKAAVCLRFCYIRISRDILLNLGMKCCNSVFNAQSSRGIIVDVQARAVKIYVAAVEALRERERP
jgi:hypothetical protein